MSELEEKLNTLLSDPDGMAQVLELAQKLSSQHDEPPTAPSPPQQDAPGELSSLLGLLGSGTEGDLLRRLLPVLQRSASPESGQAAALLYALRPFLREERRGKVERAVQLSRMLCLGKTLLAAKEEDEHV